MVECAMRTSRGLAVVEKPVLPILFNPFSDNSAFKAALSGQAVVFRAPTAGNTPQVSLVDPRTSGKGMALGASEPSQAAEKENSFFPLFDLPLEIRLNIYRWVHRMHPIEQAQLTPWYPVPVFNSYFLRTISVEEGKDQVTEDQKRARRIEDVVMGCIEEQRLRTPPCDKTQLLSPYRPLAGVPTALLCSNKQLYHEIKDLPFQENEFVFINWFASGLWAARSFVRGLRPWPRGLMRYARLELLARDLSGSFASEWGELCGFWSPGLRGLRIKIMSGGDSFGSWLIDGAPHKGAPVVNVRNAASGTIENWVSDGLGSMPQLTWLEVELALAHWDNQQKVEWCRELQAALDECRPQEYKRVRVTSVEHRPRGSK